MRAFSSTTFAVAAAAVATLSSSADAAGAYKVTCLFTSNKCSTDVMLRYFESSNSCTEGTCEPLTVEGKTDFSNKQQCKDDIVADAKAVMGSNQFVLVQQHKEDGCSSAASNATAVVANGKCYPFIDGKSSYMVELGKDKAATWTMFSTSGKCEGAKTTQSFKPDEMDGKKCMPGRMTVLLHSPEGSDKTTMPPKDMTEMPPKDMTNMPADNSKAPRCKKRGE